MTTPSDMILFALKKLRVRAAGESLRGEDADDGLVVFNRMMHGLKAKGADLGWRTIGLSDSIPIDPEYEQAIEYLLATELAAMYSAELTPEVAVNAADGLNLLRAHFKRAPTLTAPEGTLNPLETYGWNINNG